jgi:hypothetical protein
MGTRPSGLVELLLARQNADGGFGFRRRQSSWLEPTMWAALALHGRPETDRAMAWAAALQLPGGAWLAHPEARRESWAASLVILLKCLRGEFDGGWKKAVDWLVASEARRIPDPSWLDRLLGREDAVVQDRRLRGWPWTPGAAGWIEPTVHAVRALEHSRARYGGQVVAERIEMGVRMIADRQCRDGGWNYGNKRVLGEDLESYPECTALGLIGLCGRRGPEVERGLRCALEHWRRGPRGLAQALLRIAFRMHGVPFEDRPVEVREWTETSVLALAMIGEPEGSWRLWKGGAA